MHSPYFPSILGLQCLVPFLYCIINLTFASFSPSYSHSIREFSVFLSFFFSHINVASSFYSIDFTLSFLLPFAFSSPYFLSPPYVSFSTSRSRVKPSATTGPADEKEISSLSLSSFPFLLLPYSTFLSRLYSAIVRDSAKEQRCRQAGPELLS